MSVNMRDEIITSIDSINSVIQESEYDVTLSLLGQTTKMAFILEGCDNYYDAEQFSIFQEAEESTIASGDPSGTTANATATVQQKKGLLGSLWEKIVKIFNAIKKFFIGDTAALTAAAAKNTKDVPEDAASLLDKVSSKDPSWTKENFSAWGLAQGALPILLGIATGCATVRLRGQNFLGLLATFGLLNAGVKQVIFCTTGRVIKTNIRFVVLVSIVTKMISDIASAIEYKKKMETDSNFATQEKLKDMQDTLGELTKLTDGIQTENPEDIAIEEFAGHMNELKKAFEKLEGIELGENAIKDEEKKESKVDSFLKKIPVIGSALLSIKQFISFIIKQITELLQNLPIIGGFFKKKNEGDESSSTENNTEVTEISAKDLFESLSDDDKTNKYEFKGDVIIAKGDTSETPIQALKDKNGVEWVARKNNATMYDKKPTPETTPDEMTGVDLFAKIPTDDQANYKKPENDSDPIKKSDDSNATSITIGSDTYNWDDSDKKYKKQAPASDITMEIDIPDPNDSNKTIKATIINLGSTVIQGRIDGFGTGPNDKYTIDGNTGKLVDKNGNQFNDVTIKDKNGNLSTFNWVDAVNGSTPKGGYQIPDNTVYESYVDETEDQDYVQESFSSYYYR